MQTNINTAPKYIIYHYVNGKLITDNAIGYNDAFYEITDGDRKGCLVHVWDVKTFDRIKQDN